VFELRTFFEEADDILILSGGIRPPRRVNSRKRRHEREVSDRATRARAPGEAWEHTHKMSE
jgi:hypothetical protein